MLPFNPDDLSSYPDRSDMTQEELDVCDAFIRDRCNYTVDAYSFACLCGWMLFNEPIPLSSSEAGLD